MGILDSVFNHIGLLLYGLFAILFKVIKVVQDIFLGLAGMGGDVKVGDTQITSGNTGGEQDSGILYYFLTSDFVKNLFLSILVLGLFLIIIFTAMAFIKNAYASKQKTWQEIVGNAFKGLANFIFVPVCCILGVWLGNILLNAINGATGGGENFRLDKKVFITCAYDANKIRQGDVKIDDNLITDISALCSTHKIPRQVRNADGTVKTTYTQVSFDSNHDRSDREYFASVVDEIFVSSDVGIFFSGDVAPWYKLIDVNYIMLAVCGGFILYVLISLAYAMFKRLVLLTMMFIISPAVCAMYPLDEGSAVGTYKKEFLKHTISAYGAVAGMNLFFSILPLINDIRLTDWNAGNTIIQIFFLSAGLFIVKDFIGLISGWFGGDDALSSGASLRNTTKGAMKKAISGTVGTISGTAGAFARAKGASDAAGGGWKGFKAGLGSFAKSTLEGADKMVGLGIADWTKVGKNTRDAYKAGRSEYGDKVWDKEQKSEKKKFEKQNFSTDGVFGYRNDDKGTMVYDSKTQKYRAATDKELNDANVQKYSQGFYKSLDDKQIYETIKAAGYAGIGQDEAVRKIHESTGMDISTIQKIFNDQQKQADQDRMTRAQIAAQQSRTSFGSIDELRANVSSAKTEVNAKGKVVTNVSGEMKAIADGIDKRWGRGDRSGAKVQAQMRSQLSSGNVAEFDTNGLSGKFKETVEAWNQKVQDMVKAQTESASANMAFTQAIENMKTAAESMSATYTGMKNALTEFENNLKDAGKDIDKMADAASKMHRNMNKAVKKENIDKSGSGGAM